jgi:hypothetical protein
VSSQPVRLPLPPRSATPAAYYLEYLPRLWAAFVAALPPVPLTGKVTAKVGGEAFTLWLDGGQLHSEPGLGVPSVLTFDVPPEDFAPQLRELVPRLVRYTERHIGRAHDSARRFATERAAHIDTMALMRDPGRVELLFTDDAGDTTRVGVTVGNGHGPVAHVHIGERDLLQALESGGRVAKLLGTRLRVDGDLGYVLRLVGMIQAG